MRKVLIIFILLISSWSFAQITTTKVKAGSNNTNPNSLIYALPEVKIRVDVYVEKTTYLEGPYSTFANKMLGISDIIEFDHHQYVIKDMVLSTEYFPDPQQLYAINLGELSGKSEYSSFLSVEESGLFGGISNPQLFENNTEKQSYEKIIKGSKEFKYFADANLVEKVDTIIRRVDIDTATIEKATLKRYSVEKDIATRAQDAATYLMEIRKNRFELISGYHEVAYSAGSLGLMNEALKQLENDYLALFAGKTLLSDQHFTFYFTPKADQPNIVEPIFKFSEDNGVSDLSGGGSKVNIAIKSNGLAENLNDISTEGLVNGIIYRIPETAEVWVKLGAQEFDKQIINIPQLGKIQNIEPGRNQFEFHPTTGGIKMLEIRE
jgi:hypothetical protein